MKKQVRNELARHWMDHQYEESESMSHSTGSGHGLDDEDLVVLFGSDDTPIVIEPYRNRVGF